MNTSNVLGLEITNTSIAEAVEYGMKLVNSDSTEYVITVDSEKMHEISVNKRLRRAANAAAMVLPEGSGVLLASSILGNPIRYRVSEIDFASALLARMSEKGMSVYVFGPDYDRLETVKENLAARFPGLVIFGGDEGYYYNELELVEDVNKINPHLLLACQGSPRQEYWMLSHKDDIKAGLMLGFGDGFDYFSGEAQRAPKRWRDSGFEWLYWVIKEPRRLIRTLKRTWIIFAAVWRRIFG